MITVDIVSPGGSFSPAASANAQELTANFSITSGSNTLTCNNASPFVSGDTGKYLLIQGPGSDGATGTWLFGTMTYVSSSQVTLSVNATKTISNQSAYVAWGNDDSAAFRAFNTWAQGQSDSITLTLGGGSKKFFFCTSDSNNIRGGSPSWGVANPVTIQGNGSASTKFIFTNTFQAFGFGAPNWMKAGNGFWPNFGVDLYIARLNSVSAGATQLTCKTVGDAAFFTSGTWAVITGLDLQGGGQPPNPFLFEYVKMTNVNTSTGVITLQSGLTNAYSDTWPSFATGGMEPDHGGPATLYALDPNWDQTVTFQGISTFNPGGQSATKCRDITFTDVTVLDSYGIFPTASKNVTFNSCNLTNYQMEVDKMAENVIIDGTSTGQLLFQSSIDNVTIRNGSNITGGLNGTSRAMTIAGSTVNGVSLGASSFGRTDSFSATGSTFTGTLGYGGVADVGDNTGSGIGVDYTLSNGLITMPRSGRTYPGLRWAVPGTKCYFTGQESSGNFRIVRWGPSFTVISVTADATNIYVQTNWPFSGGFASWMRSIKVLPSQYMSLASDTVTSVDDFLAVKAATAAGYTIPGVYRSISFNGGNCGNDSSPINLTPFTGGKLVSFTVNVTTPYTGTSPTLNWRPIGVAVENGATISDYLPSFNLKTAGARIITPSGVTGAQSGDSSLALPSAGTWLSNLLTGCGTGQANITSEYNGNPSVGPVFSVELILNQNISTMVAPLWMRLHA